MYKVITCGPVPSNRGGGVSRAVEAFIEGLKSHRIYGGFIGTYSPNGEIDKRDVLARLSALDRRVKEIRSVGNIPVLWGHGGGYLGCARQLGISRYARFVNSEVITVVHLHSSALLQRITTSPYIAYGLNVSHLRPSMYFVPTPGWSAELRKSGINATYCVPNGAREELVSYAGRLKGNSYKTSGLDGESDGLRILVLTRLVKGKGVRRVIECAPRLGSEDEIIVAGEGPLSEELKAKAEEGGAQGGAKIELIGWVTGNRKREVFEAADVFCLLSSAESFGMSYLEAMAFGLPVICQHTQVTEFVVSRKCGFLLEDTTVESVVNAVGRCRKNSVRRRVGKAGQMRILNKFRPERVVMEALASVDDYRRQKEEAV